MTKKREYTEKQTAFLDALFGEAEGDYRKAMKIAGYSDNIKVKEVVSSLKDEIVDLAKMHMAMNAPKAAMKMTSLLDKPDASGAANLIKVAMQVLDRSGATVPTGDVINVPKGGIFIMPAKERVAEVEKEADDGEDQDD